jgi:uncharacterized protein YceH (UPF0502 family)
MEAIKDLNLTAVEIRVLGTLIEKSKTTPEYYPMTINALTAACNQKTSRNPVSTYTEQEITQAIGTLKGKSLVATAVGGTSRSIKYKHNFGTVFDLSDAAITVLCLLMLRGAQTGGEINTNSGRIYEFRDLGEVQQVMSDLVSGETPFIKELPRRPGQKENRFIHLLGATETETEASESQESATEIKSPLEERVSALEEELAQLKFALRDLLGN